MTPTATRRPRCVVHIRHVAALTAGVGYLAGGIVTAIVTACTVATALHKIIA